MELEQRSEAVEREVISSLYSNCPAATKKALGLRVIQIDDALLLTATHDPAIMLNRAHGLCTNKEIKPSTIQKIAATYTALGIKHYFLHLYIDDQPQASRQQLINAGLIATRGWMRFIRDNAAPDEIATDLRVEKINSEHAGEFARIACEAFDMSEAAAPLIAALANDPCWHLYASFDGQTMVGTGATFVHDEIAWLDWGATAPQYRCKGSQSAIMAARINDAKSLGCKHIVTETGEAVEGDPQHAYHNIIKHGFAEMRVRQNYTRQSS